MLASKSLLSLEFGTLRTNFQIVHVTMCPETVQRFRRYFLSRDEAMLQPFGIGVSAKICSPEKLINLNTIIRRGGGKFCVSFMSKAYRVPFLQNRLQALCMP
jgi:hypothetical protein